MLHQQEALRQQLGTVDDLGNLDPIPLEDEEGEGVFEPISYVPESAKSSEQQQQQAATSQRNTSKKRGKNKLSSREEDPEESRRIPGPPRDINTPDWKKQAQKALSEFSPLSVRKSSKKQANEDGNVADYILHPVRECPSPPPPAKLKSAFKQSAANKVDDFTPMKQQQQQHISAADNEQSEYRKTLQTYMTNHQQMTTKASGAVDIDDDISESEGDVGGIDASAWIQQALQSPGDVSNRKKKKNQEQQPSVAAAAHAQSDSRSAADKDDFMSTDFTDGRSIMDKSMDCGKSLECMSIMSLALSEVEQSLTKPSKDHPDPHHHHSSDDDDSDLGSESINFDSNHGDRRMMGRSGASTHSIMSELTDFSVSGDEDDDDSVCL
jgi:hypothetical protein